MFLQLCEFLAQGLTAYGIKPRMSNSSKSARKRDPKEGDVIVRVMSHHFDYCLLVHKPKSYEFISKIQRFKDSFAPIKMMQTIGKPIS